MDRITIIGTGLIGTSLGLALKKANLSKCEIVGHDKEPSASSKAQRRGAVDKADRNLISSVEGARIVIIATPPMAIRETMEYIAPHLAEGVLVTDTGSTKSNVLKWADEIFPAGVNFVGGHPMAGKESSGPDAAEATLFDGATYAICATPSADYQAVQTLASLVESIGATPYFIGAEEHDSYVAAVSHLPFILSVALVGCTSDSPSWDDISTLAASGYRDITRLASGDPVMHRDICVTNQESIIKWIDQFITYLYKFRNDVRDDPDAVELALISAWQARSRWLSGAKVNQSTVSADLPSANDSMMGLVMGDRMSSRLRELNQRLEKNDGNRSSR